MADPSKRRLAYLHYLITQSPIEATLKSSLLDIAEADAIEFQEQCERLALAKHVSSGFRLASRAGKA